MPYQNQLQHHTISAVAPDGWLDHSSELDATFASLDDDQDDADSTYFTLSESREREIQDAAETLHNMFLAATDAVLACDELLAKFQIPLQLWGRIRESWDQKELTVAGRLDLAVDQDQIKAFEYNIDTASCLFEAGSTQGRWADALALPGRDAGGQVFDRLVAAWKATGATGTMHMMHDDDDEERYHALYMKSAAEAAGLNCKLVCGVEGLSRAEDGTVLDKDGVPIRTVWKTWAWETVFDELAAPLAGLQLSDVLLRAGVSTYEPLWTAIPNNKAILPVLWALFPGHRNLLRSEFVLSEELLQAPGGYVQKPIVGRCGQGVTMIDAAGDVVASLGTTRFADKNSVYQELRPLPHTEAGSVLVCPWIIGGQAAGLVLRVDKSLITTVDSPIVCLRIVKDVVTPRPIIDLCLRRSCSEPMVASRGFGGFAMSMPTAILV